MSRTWDSLTTLQKIVDILVVLFVLWFFAMPYMTSATGEQADMQCPAKLDYKTKCMMKNPKTGQMGGMDCPCMDMTNGFPTPGMCVAAMKCKATMPMGQPPMMPMLPMPPMPMPMMPMPAGTGCTPGVPGGVDANGSPCPATQTPPPCPSGVSPSLDASGNYECPAGSGTGGTAAQLLSPDTTTVDANTLLQELASPNNLSLSPVENNTNTNTDTNMGNGSLASPNAGNPAPIFNTPVSEQNLGSVGQDTNGNGAVNNPNTNPNTNTNPIQNSPNTFTSPDLNQQYGNSTFSTNAGNQNTQGSVSYVQQVLNSLQNTLQNIINFF